MAFVFDMSESIVGKGGDDGYKCKLSKQIFQTLDYNYDLSASGKTCIVAGNMGIKNPLPNDKFLDQTGFKAFADTRLNVAKMVISVYGRVQIIVGKGANAGYLHFLLFQQCIKIVYISE